MEEFKSPHSSNIAGARYENRTLEIDFKHGGTYIYEGFPKKLWTQFKASMSKGTFLSQHIIKDRHKPKYIGIKKEKMNDKSE